MYPSFLEEGVSLVAISAYSHQDSLEFAESLSIGFPLLWDSDLSVADAYGVAMEGRDIAIPAVFVISPEGHIQWKQVGETMMDRADPAVMLERAVAARGDRD